MYDLLALALQTDSTRNRLAAARRRRTNRAFPEIGIAEGHHYCSHQPRQSDLIAKVGRIDRFYMEHFARFLGKLARPRIPTEPRCSQLDDRLWLRQFRWQPAYSHQLAGGAGRSGRRYAHAGRSLHYSSTPMTNLYLGLAQRMGVAGVPRIGDSTGRLSGFSPKIHAHGRRCFKMSEPKGPKSTAGGLSGHRGD